ncbi:unnamed protein product [Caretta caretta]
MRRMSLVEKGPGPQPPLGPSQMWLPRGFLYHGLNSEAGSGTDWDRVVAYRSEVTTHGVRENCPSTAGNPHWTGTALEAMGTSMDWHQRLPGMRGDGTSSMRALTPSQSHTRIPRTKTRAVLGSEASVLVNNYGGLVSGARTPVSSTGPQGTSAD